MMEFLTQDWILDLGWIVAKIMVVIAPLLIAVAYLTVSYTHLTLPTKRIV